jgi:hypothetical protein
MNSKHLFSGFAVILLLYSAWRSFDYLMIGLVGVNQTTAIVVSLVFLFASEVGLLMWLHKGVPSSTTDAQETISKIMIFVDFIGSLTLGVADLLLHNSLYVVDFHWLDPVLLVAPAVLVAANVGAVVLYHLSDADERLKRADRQLDFEEAQLEIASRTAAIKQLKSSRREIGEKLAPSIYAHIRERVTGRTVSRFEKQAKAALNPPTLPILTPAGSPARKNGHNTMVYNSETDKTPELAGDNFLAEKGEQQ